MSERGLETLVTSRKQLLLSGDSANCLVHIYPTNQSIGRRYPLGVERLRLGRGDDNDIRIHDNSVSRRHAVIEPDSDGYLVLDLGSTNGTYVNDQQVTMPTVLRDGNFLRVGNCIY